MERHRFDIVSFIFGLIFGGLGLTFLITEVGTLSVGRAWFWPALIVVAGIALLVSSVVRVRRRD